MNRILLTGAALLALINAAVPANATMRYQQAPVQQESFGKGVRVDATDRNSAAAKAGLRPGWSGSTAVRSTATPTWIPS